MRVNGAVVLRDATNRIRIVEKGNRSSVVASERQGWEQSSSTVCYHAVCVNYHASCSSRCFEGERVSECVGKYVCVSLVSILLFAAVPRVYASTSNNAAGMSSRGFACWSSSSVEYRILDAVRRLVRALDSTAGPLYDAWVSGTWLWWQASITRNSSHSMHAASSICDWTRPPRRCWALLAVQQHYTWQAGSRAAAGWSHASQHD